MVLLHNVDTYIIVRFIAGVGLAGELGAGITLVTETMSKEKRGYGTMIVAVIGLFGAAAANLVATHGLPFHFSADHANWRDAYFVGGCLGIILLLLRLGTFESGMFKSMERNENVSKGNFFTLFSNWNRFKKYIYCILIGAPLWYVVGVLVTLSPEFGKALGAKDVLSAGDGNLSYLFRYCFRRFICRTDLTNHQIKKTDHGYIPGCISHKRCCLFNR